MGMSATIAKLRELGVPDIAIPGVIEFIESEAAELKRPRTSTERSKACRERKIAAISLQDRCENVAETLQDRCENAAEDPSRICARVLHREKLEVKLDISSLRSDTKIPKAKTDLQIALGDELAAEVVAHRKALRKPLTPQAASRLAKKFLETGQQQDAARMMIDKGWQGFEVDWFTKTREPPGLFGAATGRERPISVRERMENWVNKGSENDQDRNRRAQGFDGNVLVLSAVGR